MKVTTWCVRSPKEWERVISYVTGGEFAFDTEYEREWPKRLIVGFSLAWKTAGEYYKVYVPFNHYQEVSEGRWERIPTQLTEQQIRSGLQTLFDSAPRVYMHNALTDLKSAHQLGIKTADVTLVDTMIMSWLLWVDRRIGHGLKELTKKFFGHEMRELVKEAPKEMVEDRTKPRLKSGKRKGLWRLKTTGIRLMSRMPIDIMTEYASEDTYYTLRLAEKFEPELSEKNHTDVFHKLCMKQILYLNEMEEVGMVVDLAALKKMRAEIAKDAETKQQEMWEFAGEQFNPKSVPQLNKLLFGKKSRFKIEPKGEKGNTGLYSTNAMAMKVYAVEGHEICQKITAFSKVKHLLGMFDGWISRAKKCRDGSYRLFGTFPMHTTRTGRLSSRDPNLQNIPVRDKTYQPRKAFIAPNGFVFLDADFSQIELRLLAHFSKDKRMVATMLAGGDIHVETAIIVYHLKPPKELDQAGVIKWVKENHASYRATSKNVNFATVYGTGARGLVLRFDMALDEAQNFLKQHPKIFPQAHAWMRSMKEYCREHGYVKTILGRRRKLPDINIVLDDDLPEKTRHYLWGKKGEAERCAVNTPVQGSAADLIGLAMVKIRKLLRASGDWLVTVFPCAQVHDELCWYVKKSEVERINQIVCDAMRSVMKLRVPIDVESGYGESWAAAK